MARRKIRYSATEKADILARAEVYFQQGDDLEDIALRMKVPYHLLSEWFREQTLRILFPRPSALCDGPEKPPVALF